MSGGRGGGFGVYLERLFREGVLGGLSDAQLLKRFVDGQDEAAFEALVERHGPMVLGVCRGVLRDPHDADDAFQATFLVLALKARSLWVGGSLGGWLHRVAHRIAIRAREDEVRRRARERRCAERPTSSVPGPHPEDELAMLHEEIGRLPERYRVPIVLCHLEGMTNEMAASKLGWPVGTVSGRLTRARELLRSRLTRRGLAPAVAVLGASTTAKAGVPTVPPALAASTIRAAGAVLAGRAALVGIVPATAATLAKGVLKTMILSKLTIAATLTLALGLVATGVGVVIQHEADDRPPPREARRPVDPPPSASPGPPFAEALRRAVQVIDDADEAPGRVDDLIAIARAQAALGEREAALATLAKAREAADRLTLNSAPSTHLVALLAIAEAHDEVGDREAIPPLIRRAGEWVEENEGGWRKVSALWRVATTLVLLDDREAARETVRRMHALVRSLPDEDERNRGRARVVSLLALLGDFDEAFRIVDLTADLDARADLLGKIAQYTVPDDDRGVPSHELSPRDRANRVEVLDRVGEQLASLDAAGQARAPVAALAMSYARLGEFENAIRLVGRIKEEPQPEPRKPPPRPREPLPGLHEPPLPVYALSEIAHDQAKAGRRDEARRTIRQVLELVENDPEHTRYDLRGAVRTLAEVGDFEAAARLAGSAPPDERVDGLIEVAERQASSGDEAGSREALRRALAAAEHALANPPEIDSAHGVWPEHEKHLSRGRIATIQAKLGEYDAALETAKALRADLRGDVLSRIAREQTRAGQVEAAMAWATTLDEPDDRSRAMRGIAEGIVERLDADAGSSPPGTP